MNYQDKCTGLAFRQFVSRISWPRPCLVCHNVARLGGSLCRDCRQCLRKRSKHDCEELDSGVPLWSGWVWPPGEDELLSRTVLRLKGRGNLRPWREIAGLVIERLDSSWWIDKPCVFVPVPMTKGRCHAQEFARGLSDVTGIPWVEAFAPNKSAEKQRHKKGSERVRKSFALNETFSQNEYSDLHIALVDDVVTTGETLMAAQRTLGAEHVQAISMVRRTRLDAESGLC